MAIEIRFGILKDPASALTHFVGFIAAVVGLTFLMVFNSGGAPKVAGLAIYGSTLVALFLSSSIYHFFDFGPRGNPWLRRLDHASIFLLIAGTNMPMLIHTLDGAWRVTMISVVGGLAIMGILFKLVWIGCPRVLSAGMYLALGWTIVVPAYKMMAYMTSMDMFWLALGGVLYTGGAIIYSLKKPDPWPGVFGFHEIWHLFVLAAAVAHYFLVFSFVDRAYPPF